MNDSVRGSAGGTFSTESFAEFMPPSHPPESE
jgi:hypothetical protein